MIKSITYGKEAREKIKSGINKVADAVVTTLGPIGKNVIISRSLPSQNGMQFFNPLVTKDGVTVARNIILNDYLENVGCLIIREASEKTMSMCGDGTTTSVLLMRAIVNAGLELIDKGYNPQQLKKEIDEAVEDVVKQLKEMAVPISGDIEKIRQVATVSANNDSVIGDLIAEAFSKIGTDGILNIEEAKGVNTEIKVTSGIKIERGWVSPYFINNPDKSECILENPYILLYDKKISIMEPLTNLVQLVASKNRPLLIICDDADGEALASFAMNASQKKFISCIIRSPEFGDAKREAMEDLAILTGGHYISDEKGLSLKGVKEGYLGRAQKVIVSKEEAIIITDNADNAKLNDLLNTLKMDLVKAEGDERDKIEKRIAKLTGGIGVICVGASTETEMKEKKDRVDDAIRATKSAISEGYVVGGGTAYLRVKTTPFLSSILEEPLIQICKNAGISDSKILDSVKSEKDNIGYNAKIDKIENLEKAGIIDPVKVLRCCLQNAASAATMVLTSDTLICDVL